MKKAMKEMASYIGSVLNVYKVIYYILLLPVAFVNNIFQTIFNRKRI